MNKLFKFKKKNKYNKINQKDENYNNNTIIFYQNNNNENNNSSSTSNNNYNNEHKIDIDNTTLQIQDGEAFFADEYVWKNIFIYIYDPRSLTTMVAVCKKFYEILTKNNALWRPAYTRIRLEYTTTCITRMIKFTNYTTQVAFPNEYARVSAYGKTIHSYRTSEAHQKRQEEARRQRKTQLRKQRGANVTITTIIFLLVYYAFLALLGLKLDNLIYIPTFALMIPVLAISGYVMCLVFFTMSCGFYSSSMRVLRKIVKCNKRFLFGIFCLSISIFSCALVSYVSYQTGKLTEWLWLFAGIIFLCLIYIIFTFSCVPKLIKSRYNPGFRCTMASVLVLFYTSVSIFVYTNMFPSEQTSAIITWSEWMLVASYAQIVLYMYTFGVLGGSYSYMVDYCEKFYLGNFELLTASTIFATTALGFCKIVYSTNFLWSVVLAPMYLTPLFTFYLFYHYHSYYDKATKTFMRY